MKSTAKTVAAAKKKATKKVIAKKAAAKKSTAKKKAAKKVTAKKKAAKKPVAKKATAKKPTAKKAAAKKTVAKKTTTKKPPVNKAPTKKASAKDDNVVAVKPAAKKTPAKKAAAKNTAEKKTAVKKTAAKKTASKKVTAKTTATDKKETKIDAKEPVAEKKSKKKAAKSAPTLAVGEAVMTTVVPYEREKNSHYMDKDQLAYFSEKLADWKQQLMEEVDRTVDHMKDDATNFPDPNDRATQEEEFSLELRTRDRERKLIKKINEAQKRIEENEYGYCETCGVEIGVGRLEARPTAELCIDCKTLEEIREKQIA